MDSARRLITTVLTASDFDASVAFYRDGVGLDLHVADHAGDDIWTSGRHAAVSWSEGEFVHFAIYEAKPEASPTSGAQIAFRVDDLDIAHTRAITAGVDVVHPPNPQPWGRSARYRDPDGNVVELTQPT